MATKEQFWAKTKRIFRLTLIFGSILAVIAFGSYLLFARYVHYSDGYRSGRVVKFSKKGVIWKTWEGQLQFGEAGNNLWEFSVYPGDESVQQEIQDAMTKNAQVKMHYEESYVKLAFWGDTKYFVDEVLELED